MGGLWQITHGQWLLLLFVPIVFLFISALVLYTAKLRKQEPKPWIFILTAVAFVVSLVVRYKADVLYIVPVRRQPGLIYEPAVRLTPEQLSPAQASHLAWTSNIGFAATLVVLLFLLKNRGASNKALLIGIVISTIVVMLYGHFALA